MTDKTLCASAPRRSRKARPLAPVLTLAFDRHQRGRDSVVNELSELLARAMRGEFIGLAYVVLKPDNTVSAALSGDLARAPNRDRAAGMLFRAAVSATYDDEEA